MAIAWGRKAATTDERTSADVLAEMAQIARELIAATEDAKHAENQLGELKRRADETHGRALYARRLAEATSPANFQTWQARQAEATRLETEANEARERLAATIAVVEESRQVQAENVADVRARIYQVGDQRFRELCERVERCALELRTAMLEADQFRQDGNDLAQRAGLPGRWIRPLPRVLSSLVSEDGRSGATLLDYWRSEARAAGWLD